MPDLNRRQFTQEPIEGFYGREAMPAGLLGRLPKRAPTEPVDALGPDTKRGQVGEFQQVLNFDHPEAQLETDRAGLVPVDEQVDPDWTPRAWYVGGMARSDLRWDPYDEDAKATVAQWERLPVETIGPDDEVRTAQADPDYKPYTIEYDDEHVANIRAAGEYGLADPDTGVAQYPWIAQVPGKRYLLEGHHRAIAARTRGTGEFPAHVARGDSLDAILRRFGKG